MDSLTICSLSPFRPLVLPSPNSRATARVRACSSSNPNPVAKPLRAAAAGCLLLSALLSRKLYAPPPAIADPVQQLDVDPESISNPIELSSETINSLRTLLYQKLNDGEDSAALVLLDRLLLLQPTEPEWKFLAARLRNEMGDPESSRRIYEEILAADPLSFEALFENAVLMDRCGEHAAALQRLESALEAADSEKSARDVKLIMAQVKFLQKDVEEALEIYEELAREDPKDYRPWFCQGVIYSLTERNKEAREKFAKYKELVPKKFEVDAYLQSPLSRTKLFGTEDS